MNNAFTTMCLKFTFKPVLNFQIWFDLPIAVADSSKALSAVVQLTNNGQMKATVKTTTTSSMYSIRMSI